MIRRAATLVGAGLAAFIVAAAPASAATCPQWKDRVLASGLGALENLEPDNRGGLMISASTRGEILRLTPDGKVTTAVPNVKGPGGQRVIGDTLFFNTNNTAQSALSGATDGTIDTFNLKTRARATFATGLTMPNGLAVLPNGDFVTSRDLGTGTGITRVPKSDPTHPQTNWVQTNDSNGMAVDPNGKYLYYVETFTSEQAVKRVEIANPANVTTVARLMSLSSPTTPAALDDITIDADGILYVTGNLAGIVVRVDPKSGDFCTIAKGLQFTSAVKFGRGPGWNPVALFATGFDGLVHELTPPAGSVPRVGALSIKTSPSRVTARAKARRIKFTVTSADGLPVEGATVKFARASGKTDARGIVKLSAKLTAPGKRSGAATREGFSSARATVRVTRP